MAGVNPSVQEWSATQGETALSTNTITPIKAAVTGKVHFLSTLQVQNAHASVATVISIIDDTATVIWSGYFPAVPTLLANTVPPIIFDPPLRSSMGKALSIKAVTTGATIYWNAQGFDA
jgi:hypothetical protein